MATVNIDATLRTLVMNTGTLCTATATAADTATLIITPTGRCDKLVLILESSAATPGVVNVAKGDFWGGKAMTEVTLAQNVPKAFVFESARLMTWDYNNAEDTYAYRIIVTLGTPANTTKYTVLQLP